ncbi:MAG: acetyl-CoA carboxylase biotin carboxyl carrier protein [Bacteroidota bacterium]|jgi:acetyl-CoA carboxylase biotin carboxyl carrier protein
MDIKEIQDLIKLINKSNIGELNIERGDFKLNIKQKEEKVMTVSAMPQQVVMQAAPAQIQAAPAAPASSAASPAATPEKEDNLVVVKSPMIGTFYRRPGPDKPIFAEVGDEVSVGKVLCIIEAMKLFNEIESEVAGRIVKILVDDASPVEYDQPLFLVDPL